MNYSEKLKDLRWLQFREAFIASRRREGSDDECEDCGGETCGNLHVHHRRYIDGREPWEYSYEDLRLLCEECHDRIHRTEDRARAIIRSAEAHVSNEFDNLLSELEEALKVSNHALKVALSHAKNSARSVVYAYQQQQPITEPEEEKVHGW